MWTIRLYGPVSVFHTGVHTSCYHVTVTKIVFLAIATQRVARLTVDLQHKNFTALTTAIWQICNMAQLTGNFDIFRLKQQHQKQHTPSTTSLMQ